MLQCVMGRPGAGKSTYLAYLAGKSIKQGKKVYSNVYIKGCYKIVKEDFNKYLIEDALIIIDEAGMEFNSRNFKSFTNDLYRFFTLSRHYNLDIVLAVQYWDRLDVVIRELLHRVTVVRPTVLGYFFLRTKDIGCNIGVSESKQIVEEYDWLPFSTRYILKRRLFSMFDSFYRDPLMFKEFDLW